MKAGNRIWKTASGRFVPDGHPDAAHLAYAASDECPEHVVREAYPPAPEPEPVVQEPAEEKAAKQAPNKARKAGGNKASTGEDD